MYKVLKSKKVLVTGGAGFIGSHIVDRLVSLGAEVVVLDNLCEGKIENIAHNLDKIKFIQKDLNDEEALGDALKGVNFISHQAALRSVPKSVADPFKYHQNNVTGTLKLFLKAKEKRIRRVVFASSSAVYGERFDFPEKENDSANPMCPYGATKLIAEEYAHVFSNLYDLEIVALRYFNVFGPRQSLESQYAIVVPKFIACLLNGDNPPIYGDGNQERDFVYIDNVVEANILALIKDNVSGEVFNIASGIPQSVNNLLESLKNIIGKDISPVYVGNRPGEVLKTQADIGKAKKILGWEPKIDFNQGLEQAVEWFRNSIES